MHIVGRRARVRRLMMRLTTVLVLLLCGTARADDSTLLSRAKRLGDWSVDVAQVVGAALTSAPIPTSDARPEPITPALLVALTWAESRGDVRAAPGCGVMQVFPADVGRPSTDCARWRRSVADGVAIGVVELRMLLTDRRVGGDRRLALLYRACGNAWFAGTCADKKIEWVHRVLEIEQQLRGAL